MRLIAQRWGDRLTRYNLLGTGGILMLDVLHEPWKRYPMEVGDGYLWNLTIDEPHRRHHSATALMKKAESIAREQGCKRLWLDWSIKEAPQWVFDWYVRLGYDEKRFGEGCALMCKELKND